MTKFFNVGIIPHGGISFERFLTNRTYMAYRPKDEQDRILHRLRIAKGHLEKVIKMINDDAYCIDVLHQMQAIESGLKETGHVVLENHLKICVSDSIARGNKDEAIAEIMTVFKRSLR